MHRVLDHPVAEAIAAPPAPDVFVMPCSASQKRFWMLEQISPGATAFVIPIAVQLSGPLDVAVLDRALNEIVRRHEILRTSFGTVEGEPRQIITTAAALKLHRMDLGNVPREGRQARIERVMSEEAERPVPITQAPLLRTTLVQVAPEEAVLMLTAHHIISDGWSNGILVRELGLFYHALLNGEAPELEPLPIQYADYVLWQEEWLKSEAHTKQLAYWKSELAGEIPVLQFPTDFARQSEEMHEAFLESRLLPAKLTEALKQLCRESGTTLFMIFYSAYVALLQRYSGQKCLMVGTTGANRNRPELEGLIGLFANLLLLKSDVPRGITFRDLLAQQRDHLLNSFANHEAPFERVLEQWQSEKRRLPKNLIQTHFLFQKAFMQPMTRDGLTIQPLYSVSPGSSFELTFGIVERAEGIRLQMEYRTSLFRRSTITRFLAHFQALLESAITSPETPLDELPIFSKGEHEELAQALDSGAHPAANGSRALDPQSIFDELDRQIEEHFERDGAPFVEGVRLPDGVALVALNEQLEFLPVGIPGPLYLADLGGGWADRSDAMRRPGASVDLYKTDFVGRPREGGGIDLWGRAEDVIELPVFRFNRRIVEVRLKLHPEVNDAVAVVHSVPGREPKLLAYVELKARSQATGETLRAFLREKVSDLLVPSTIVVVPELPRDFAGKVAREKLAPPSEPEKKRASSYVPLHGVLQEQLLAVWCETLKTSDISIDDNFFELGGNSFLALGMMVEAGKLAHRTLPLSLLLTGATVRNLARFINDGQAESEAAKPLIPVQTAGKQPPLFFLHGDWVGGGFYCNQLSRHLGDDQPFYALPPLRWDKRQMSSLSEMAAQHRAAIRAQFPRGPYRIGGYCIGSLVAMEMARQWQAEGETIEHLLLLDPPVWADGWLRGAWALCNAGGRLLGWSLERRIAFFDRYPVPANRWLKLPLDRKFARLRHTTEPRSKVREGEELATPPGGGTADAEAVLDGMDYSVYYLAYRLHRLRPLSVSTTLFVPESTIKSRVTRMIEAARLDPETCQIKIVPGNHTTFITQDISEMAGAMRTILERA